MPCVYILYIFTFHIEAWRGVGKGKGHGVAVGVTMNYSWEGGGSRKWEALENSAKGLRMNSAVELQRKQRERNERQSGLPSNVKTGLIRHLVLCIDMSQANARAIDYKPSRLQVIYESISEFLRGFFHVNPLSQLMIVVTKDGIAESTKGDVTGTNKREVWSSSPHVHLETLKDVIMRSEPSGLPSIQKAHDLALTHLKPGPKWTTRELMYIASSLCTNDAKHINASIEGLRDNHVRCSVVGMGGEMHVLRRLADETGGTYHVALDSNHLKDLIISQKEPPPLVEKNCLSKEAHRFMVGFPKKIHLSTWDLDLTDITRPTTFRGGYECPQCKTHCNGELPLRCHICGLNLLSSPYLARSYHHLLPNIEFEEVSRETLKEKQPSSNSSTGQIQPLSCFCCNEMLNPDRDLIFQCKSCGAIYSDKCVDFVRETLFNCGSCLQKTV